MMAEGSMLHQLGNTTLLDDAELQNALPQSAVTTIENLSQTTSLQNTLPLNVITTIDNAPIVSMDNVTQNNIATLQNTNITTIQNVMPEQLSSTTTQDVYKPQENFKLEIITQVC